MSTVSRKTNYRYQLTLKSGTVLLSCHERNGVLINGGEKMLDANFACPEEMAVSERGILYVVDRHHHCVQIFDESTLQRLGSFGCHGSDEGCFNQPVGIAVSDGRIWVADNENHRVQAFDEQTRAHILTLGKGYGFAPGQMFCPCGVALYKHQTHGELVIVSEWGNGRIQIFKSDTGEVMSIFGGMSHLHHAVVSDKGDIWVSEHATGKIRRFAIDGDTLRTFNSGVVSIAQPVALMPKDFITATAIKRKRPSSKISDTKPNSGDGIQSL